MPPGPSETDNLVSESGEAEARPGGGEPSKDETLRGLLEGSLLALPSHPPPRMAGAKSDHFSKVNLAKGTLSSQKIRMIPFLCAAV